MAKSLEILMATYNSAKWIEEQLESILGQTYGEFRLLVRDDGSSDQTLALLEGFARKDSRVVVLKTDGHNLGAIQNFSALLGLAEADWVMLSDADDVWLPEKIEKTVDKMREIEAGNGPATPMLVHTDLSIVDSKLNLRAKSFWSHAGLNPFRGRKINRLLIQNNVTGCTVLLNRALVEKARPVHRDALMHDHWIALVASAFGEIGVVDESTILYRRHSKNVTSDIATPYKGRYIVRRIGKLSVSTLNKVSEESRRSYESMRKQATAFLATYHNELTTQDIEMLQDFLNLQQMNGVQRRMAIIKHAFYRMDLMSNFVWLLFA
ncbi:MAG: glycosyltransferase family 2 protein [Pyrinomonadaceae bacterium]|nr:glycosyltransferase family 2 protein [Pyrinomonadaceae bacterium]